MFGIESYRYSLITQKRMTPRIFEFLKKRLAAAKKRMVPKKYIKFCKPVSEAKREAGRRAMERVRATRAQQINQEE